LSSVLLKKYELRTDSDRSWSERGWKGDFLVVLRNDVEDFQLMFDELGSDEDMIDIPRIDFGENSVTIQSPKEFKKVFVKHGELADGIIRIIVGREDNTYTLRPADTLGKTPVIYNVTLVEANTEYSQALPLGTKKFAVKERDGNAIRLAYTSGQVATPTEPYLTLLANQVYWEDDVLLSNKTLYLAAPDVVEFAERHVDIVAWT